MGCRECDRQARVGDAGGRHEEGGKQEEDRISKEGSGNRTQSKIITKRKTEPERTRRGWGHLRQGCNHQDEESGHLNTTRGADHAQQRWGDGECLQAPQAVC